MPWWCISVNISRKPSMRNYGLLLWIKPCTYGTTSHDIAQDSHPRNSLPAWKLLLMTLFVELVSGVVLPTSWSPSFKMVTSYPSGLNVLDVDKSSRNGHCYSPTIVGLIISKQPAYGDRSDDEYKSRCQRLFNATILEELYWWQDPGITETILLLNYWLNHCLYRQISF